MQLPQRLILSRTDNLGDVILTLPLAGFLKRQKPEMEILFLGQHYTRPLVDACRAVDRFVEVGNLSLKDLKALEAEAILHVFPTKELARMAKKARIPQRVGTSHRLYHWATCNRKVNLGRKKSNLHEAQLNFRLLEPFGLEQVPALAELAQWYDFSPREFSTNIGVPEDDRIRIALHPKSRGSSMEWPLDYYLRLVETLPPERFLFFVTGTATEGDLIRQERAAFFELPHVVNLTGRLSLGELVGFLSQIDGMVACSTGPLHIAAALGKYALGLYPPVRPLFPTRWAPLGPNAEVLAPPLLENQKPGQLTNIPPLSVAETLQNHFVRQ